MAGMAAAKRGAAGCLGCSGAAPAPRLDHSLRVLKQVLQLLFSSIPRSRTFF